MLLLLIIITVLLPLSYYTFKKDIASPTFLFYVGFFISAVAACFNLVAWNIIVSDKLIIVFILGWLAFFSGELIVREVIYKERNRGDFTRSCKELKVVSPSRLLTYLFILLDIAVTFLLFREVRQISVYSGIQNGNIMYNFKANLAEVGFSGLVIQLTKITKGSAYVFAFIFVNNLIALNQVSLKEFGKNIKYIVPGVIYSAQCFLRGGRYTVIAFIIGLLLITYYLLEYKNGWKYRLSIKMLIRLMLIVFGIFIAFWLLTSVVGRTSKAAFLEYLTRYLGGSYELFSLYLNKPPEKAFETFAGLLTSFNKIGLTNVTTRSYHEFRFTSTGILLGNVYSAFRTYYNDYGLIGVALFSFVLSVVFNISYHKMRTEINVYKHTFRVILYSAFLYCILFGFFVDYFFARLSIGLFIEVLIMYLIYLLIFKTRLRTRR